MLSYQHAYHAGNFADVQKHLTLYAVIDHLLRKKSAITYVDTHAGRGFYPLATEETQRLLEYREGVLPLWQHRQQLDDPLLSAWLEAVVTAQPDANTLSCYPGSPWWLAQRLRSEDRLTLFELHPGEHEHLASQSLPKRATRIFGDGLAGLRHQVPASTPRVCVLMDPSYERKVEYHEVVESTTYVLEKARHAVVMIWYPLLPAEHHQALLAGLRDSGIRKIWQSELLLRAPEAGARGMYGSGMLVINPPWGLDERLTNAMAQVTPKLSVHSRFRTSWLIPE